MKTNHGWVRKLTSTAAAGLLAGVAAVPAAGAPASLGSAQGPAATDGTGTIALSPQPGTLRVLGAGGASADVDVRPTCGRLQPRVAAVGGGQVLFTCEAPGDLGSDEPHLLDVPTHAVRDVPGARAVIEQTNRQAHGGPSTTFTDVGTLGVQFNQSGSKLSDDGALDWHTGTRRDIEGAGETFDLDNASLTRPLCAPLQRPANDPDLAIQPYGLVLADGPFVVSTPEAPGGVHSLLALQRCGSSATTTLSRRDARWPQLGSGLVGWTRWSRTAEGENLYQPRLHVIACSRTYAWPVGGEARTAVLADAVVISRSADGGRTWRVEHRSIAGICARSAAQEQLRLAAGGRRVTARATAGSIVDARSGATTPVKPVATRAPTLRASAGARVRLTTSTPAASVRWSIAGGRSHRTAGADRDWTLTAPAQRGTRTLRVTVRDRAGGRVTFAVRVTSARR